MLDELDKISWDKLTHAYGSAADVPALLRAMQTAKPGFDRNGPLWHLFGNIWHQGTVYEATSYTVPFLFELAADKNTPDRCGILHLLSSIATGTSYLDVHECLIDEPIDECQKTLELEWVNKARAAVWAEFDPLISMTKENPQVAISAAHVLAQFPEEREKVAPVLHGMLNKDQSSLHRAGLLLLLGIVGDNSQESRQFLESALKSQDELVRQAAIVSFGKLKLNPPPPAMREAIINAIMTNADFDTCFKELPWDVGWDIDDVRLIDALDADAKEQLTVSLVEKLESGKYEHGHVGSLLDLLFPMGPYGNTPPVKAGELSPMQMRVVRAIEKDVAKGRRVFYDHFPYWGLPSAAKDWHSLAQGEDWTPGAAGAAPSKPWWQFW